MDNTRPAPLQTRGPRTCGPNGFTLVELMVTLAVAAILSAMAAPSFTRIIADQRAKGAAADLYASLSKARGEALKRNTSVSLKPNTSGQWQTGWTIPDPSDATRKLDDHGPLNGITITGPNDLTYRSSGRILSSSAPAPFTISASGTTTLWCVNVDLSGRPNQKSTTTSC